MMSAKSILVPQNKHYLYVKITVSYNGCYNFIFLFGQIQVVRSQILRLEFIYPSFLIKFFFLKLGLSILNWIDPGHPFSNDRWLAFPYHMRATTQGGPVVGCFFFFLNTICEQTSALFPSLLSALASSSPLNDFASLPGEIFSCDCHDM